MNWYKQIVAGKQSIQLPPALEQAFSEAFPRLVAAFAEIFTEHADITKLVHGRPVFRIQYPDTQTGQTNDINVWAVYNDTDQAKSAGWWVAGKTKGTGTIVVNLKNIRSSGGGLAYDLRWICYHEIVHGIDPKLDQNRPVQYKNKNNPNAYKGDQSAYRTVAHEVDAYTSTMIGQLRWMLTKWIRDDGLGDASIRYADMVLDWLKDPNATQPGLDHIEIPANWRKQNPNLWRQFATRMAHFLTGFRAELNTMLQQNQK